jgi:hypothetical protein
VVYDGLHSKKTPNEWVVEKLGPWRNQNKLIHPPPITVAIGTPVCFGKGLWWGPSRRKVWITNELMGLQWYHGGDTDSRIYI